MTTRSGSPCGLVSAWTLVAALGPLAGCAFFQELESIDSAETDTGTGTGTGTATGSGDDGSGPCSLEDDTCDDQDTVRSCNLDEGDVTVHDCGVLCGEYLNFTCLDSGTGQHGCWCVAPGTQKVYSCTELEDCLLGCSASPGDACSNQCFARTTAGTVRMYGALIFCAHAGCEELCEQNPAECGHCVELALAGQSAGCQLERSVCDSDRNDEPWP